MKRQVPRQKKIYHRERTTGLSAFSMLGGNVQEVEEGARTVDEPFEDAEPGDYARQI